MGSSLDDLRGFPEDARQDLGRDLGKMQKGERPVSQRHLKGDLAGVDELRRDSDDGNTYRLVFTVKLGDSIYVLHCFEKKSTHGIATPKRHLDLIKQRLKGARRDYDERKKQKPTAK